MNVVLIYHIIIVDEASIVIIVGLGVSALDQYDYKRRYEQNMYKD